MTPTGMPGTREAMKLRRARASRAAWRAWALLLVIAAFYALGFVFGSVQGSQDVLDAYLFPLMTFAFPAVGALIASRHPGNPVGWIMLGIGVAAGLDGVFATYLALAGGAAAPGRPLIAVIQGWGWVPVIIPPGTFLLLLFPDGHLPSPRWRIVAWMAAAAMILPSLPILLTPGSLADDGYPGLTNPLGIPALAPVLHWLFFSLVLVPLSVLCSAAGMVARFRRSRGVERLQLKWLASASAVVGVLYLLTFILQSHGVIVHFTLSQAWRPWIDAFASLAILSFGLIPISIGIGIMRYRLYEIDRIISRTLAYTLSIALLAVCYFVLVLLASMVSPVTGDSPVVVAISTLILAAMFRPLLTRMKNAIDRRFYRARYSAALVLDEFTPKVRDEVDITTLGDELVIAVQSAMTPSSISLWLREQRSRSPA